MQTFLPHESFRRSLRILDYRRLVKQVLETSQILTIIKNKKGAWARHPAVLMWTGYEPCLRYYGLIACVEYERRYGKIHACQEKIGKGYSPDGLVFPPWLGDERLHSSHRANLLRKDYAFYSAYGWKDNPQNPYWWPVKLVKGKIVYEDTRKSKDGIQKSRRDLTRRQSGSTR